MVIPNFVRQALSEEPLTVFGSGEQSRCFIHVSEVVDALVDVVKEGKAVGEVINLGTNNEVSIKELAQLIIDMTGSASEIIYIPYEKAYKYGFEDMQRRMPDISKAHNIFGFKPRKDLQDIIRDIIDEMKS